MWAKFLRAGVLAWSVAAKISSVAAVISLMLFLRRLKLKFRCFRFSIGRAQLKDSWCGAENGPSIVTERDVPVGRGDRNWSVELECDSSSSFIFMTIQKPL